MGREFKPTILLLGAGYTLTQLMKRLSTSSVLYTVKSEESLKKAGEIVGRRYHGVTLDLNSPSSIRDIFEEYPSIEIIIDSIPPRAPDGGGDMTQGVQNLCAVIKERPIKKLFYLSTTGVYGGTDGAEVNEDNLCAPSNSKADARFLCEELYGEACANFTAFRISAIYGPGRGLGTSLKNGTYKTIAGRDRWSNRIHVEDLVSILYAAIKYKGILPKVFCIADDTPSLMSEVVSYYTKTFNLPPPQEVSEEEAKKLELFTQMGSQKISNAKVKKELGIKLKYPSYKEGAATEFE